MKAKKVIGIAACAFACVTSSAFANSTTNWFGVTASPDVVATDVTIKTNNVTVAIADIVADSKITLDGDTELTFAPTDGNPVRSDNLVTISSSAVLTPNAVSDLPASGDLGGAQVGFAVAYNGDVTNYYYYAYANDAGAWTAGAGTPPANAEVTFKITLDYRTKKAKFEVGNVVVADDVTFTGTKLNKVAACGSGSLTEVSAKYEIAVVDVNGTKYGSVADAKDAGGDVSTIKKVDDAGGVIDKTTADNGLSVAVCTALGLDIGDKDANIAVAPAATDTNPSGITLAVNVTGAPEPGAVQYKVEGGSSEAQYYDANSVTIPLTAGTYTITPVLK